MQTLKKTTCFFIDIPGYGSNPFKESGRYLNMYKRHVILYEK